MKTLKEYLTRRDIWTEIQEIVDYPFFEFHTPNQLSFSMVFWYGKRLMFPDIEKHTTKEVAQLIVTNFNEKWNELIVATELKQEIGLTDGHKQIERIEREEGTKRDYDRLNKTTAFNADIMVDESSHVDSEDTKGTVESDRTLEFIKTDLKTIFNNLNYSARISVINEVMQDVAKTLTYDVY